MGGKWQEASVSEISSDQIPQADISLTWMGNQESPLLFIINDIPWTLLNSKHLVPHDKVLFNDTA